MYKDDGSKEYLQMSARMNEKGVVVMNNAAASVPPGENNNVTGQTWPMLQILRGYDSVDADFWKDNGIIKSKWLSTFSPPPCEPQKKNLIFSSYLNLFSAESIISSARSSIMAPREPAFRR